ncbi:TIGR02391 family protein [Chloroflexota bacterium]
MDKKRAISLLRQELKEIPSLKKKPHNNRDYPLWRSKINVILEDTFGEDSKEYKTFKNAGTETNKTLLSLPILDDITNQEIYIKNLNSLETCLKSIIQKHEILLLNNETPSITESPIQIFDAMNLHPKVVDASKKLFKDGHYRDAIYRAFVEVNNFVKLKAKTKRQLDGKGLMSTVFSPENPIIKLNPLETQTDKDEQEGFMYLFMGAMQGIRNPKAHENIIQNNPYIALQLIGFASLLIQTISFWKAEDT